MRNTATAFVAGLALLMAVACAEQEETSSDKQPTTTADVQKAHPKADLHKKHHAKHADPVAHADKVAELVGLDDAQKAKVLAVFKNESLSWKERKAKLYEIMTPAQQAKLKAAHKGHKGHKGHKFTAEKAKFHADKMQEKLGITDAQKAQLQTALSSGDWSKIKTVLTADQFEELKRLKRTHGYHGKHGAHGKKHAGKHDCGGEHDCAGKSDCAGKDDCAGKGDCAGPE